MDKRIFVLMFCLILLLNLVISQETVFGTYEEGDNLTLIQTCSDCTFNNITSIQYPNGSIMATNLEMTKSGTVYTYTVSGSNLQTSGRYLVNGVGDPAGTNEVWAYDFNITPSGFDNVLGFYLLILLISFGVITLGFYMSDAPLVILGSFGLYFVGFYILFYGIDGLKDSVYSWAIGILILACAFYISARSSMELLNN